MAGALKKTMVYLGFAEDDRYDDYYDSESYDDAEATPAPVAARAVPEPRVEQRTSAEVTPMPRRAALTRVVREETPSTLSRITTIHPRTYNEAKNIGEAFRDGVPVIMNLTDMGDADAKRLVDFAAGLVFGLHGSIERVTAKVFLLSPEHVEVATEEPGVEAPRGLFNQS
ncbi:MAG TPA: cell division protein SepF [Tetrasphaera sp.]|jgi:cell division inhibitor SepF|uniref:Cell division protein SepF n=1 Tax=Nostocoides vanveenii TaxID=330835 RepID=A0ABN2K4D4_9MICO|nr:cell division protein SepF [Tetrasphaera sp.]HNQ08252.1 cell division protein SepF [Tetrasphaera sp.]